MWINELATNTSTADSRIGNHKSASETMATSELLLEFFGPTARC